MLLVGELLRVQRLEAAHVVARDLEALADPQAELVLDHQQVPDHALLDRAVALRERVDEVEDEVVLLPVLGELVALARLFVVVRARDARPNQAALEHRSLLVALRSLRLAQPAGDGGLVVDVRVLTRSSTR